MLDRAMRFALLAFLCVALAFTSRGVPTALAVGAPQAPAIVATNIETPSLRRCADRAMNGTQAGINCLVDYRIAAEQPILAVSSGQPAHRAIATRIGNGVTPLPEIAPPQLLS
jgi:hypothetical protein